MGTSTTNVLLGGLYPLQFDLINDLAPIVLIASEPLLIVGKKNLPAQNLKELIAWLKAEPGKASIGIPAVGGTGHLAGLSFLKEIGSSAQFIPYRGNGPALQDLVAGQIDLQIEPASNFYAQAKAGAIKPYAVTSKVRSVAASDIPTTAEAGMPFEASLWYGLWAPKDSPNDIVAKLNAAMLDALAHEDTRKRFADLGLQAAAREQQTPEALRAFQKTEADKWWPIIKAANIKGQ
jgi:tripartite-type tricarboxylate transporter receptor subunit TctC